MLYLLNISRYWLILIAHFQASVMCQILIDYVLLGQWSLHHFLSIQTIIANLRQSFSTILKTHVVDMSPQDWSIWSLVIYAFFAFFKKIMDTTVLPFFQRLTLSLNCLVLPSSLGNQELSISIYFKFLLVSFRYFCSLKVWETFIFCEMYFTSIINSWEFKECIHAAFFFSPFKQIWCFAWHLITEMSVSVISILIFSHQSLSFFITAVHSTPPSWVVLGRFLRLFAQEI